jgi:hypothetical protein
VKTKNYIISLAIASMALVFADATVRLSRTWIDRKFLEVLNPVSKPGDQEIERIQDELHENYQFAFNDALAVVAQGTIIFLTLKLKRNTPPDSK